MKYCAQILDMRADEFEGCVLLSIDGEVLNCEYQAPEDNMKNIVLGSYRTVDLWMIYGDIKQVSKNAATFSTNPKICGGTVCGIVTKRLSANKLRVDCGKLVFDIDCDFGVNMSEIPLHVPVEVTGTYYIEFDDFMMRS